MRGAPTTRTSVTVVPTKVTAEMTSASGMPSPAVLRPGWHNRHKHEANQRPGPHETPRNRHYYTARRHGV